MKSSRFEKDKIIKCNVIKDVRNIFRLKTTLMTPQLKRSEIFIL